MVNARSWTLGVTAFVTAMLALGCQDLLGLTTGKPDGGNTGGSGGGGLTGVSSGGGGAGGAGGAGGGASSGGTGGMPDPCRGSCTSPSPCQEAVCNAGTCMLEPTPAGTLVDVLAPGDCIATQCDGAGNAVPAPLDSDSDDGNDCTWDACAAGVPGHLARRDGSPCMNGAGVCGGGACVPGACAVPNNLKDGNETGLDCGGTCPACPNSAACLVPSDCTSGFCASGKCIEPVAAVVALTANAIAYAVFNANASTWNDVTDPGMFSGLSSAGIAFDAAGEAVALGRSGGSGARTARWAGGSWTAAKLWPLTPGGSWYPAFAQTDAALYVFAQDASLSHQYAAAKGTTGDPFLPVDNANSAFSGTAATRQGHASFFYPSIEVSGGLVETRLVGGKWSPAATVMSGNYSDGQATTARIALGTLLVAPRRMGNDHLLDWVVLDDTGGGLGGALASGSIEGTTFVSPKPAPKRASVAALVGGGAVLAFKNADGALDVRIATEDGMGGLTWSPANVFPTAPLVSGEPAVARGVKGARAELVWSSTANNGIRHSRLLDDGTWTPGIQVTAGAFTSVGIATP